MGYPLAKLVRLLCALQVESHCFIRDLEAFSRLDTGLTVPLFYGRVLVLVIPDLWLAAGAFIKKGQISWPELLGAMPGGASTPSIISKGLYADKHHKVNNPERADSTAPCFSVAARAMTGVYAHGTYMVKSNDPTPPLFKQVTNSFVCQWSLSPVRRKKRQGLFGYFALFFFFILVFIYVYFLFIFAIFINLRFLKQIYFCRTFLGKSLHEIWSYHLRYFLRGHVMLFPRILNVKRKYRSLFFNNCFIVKLNSTRMLPLA